MIHWFSKNGTKAHPDAFMAMATSLAKRTRNAGDLGNRLLETVLKWRRFSRELSSQLREAVRKLL